MPAVSRRLLVFACTLLAGVAAAQAAPLRMAIEGDGAYAPYSFFGPNGELKGFDVDLAKALCAKLAEGCEIIPVDWTVIVDGLAEGRFDAAVASLAYSKERAERIHYGAPYMRSHSVFIGRADRFADVSPAALTGVRVQSTPGTVQQKFLRDTYRNRVVLEAKDLDAAYDDLVSGRVDLLLGDAVAFMGFLESDRGTDFAFVGEPLTGGDLESDSFITLRKGIDHRAAELAEALKQVRLDGTFDRINRAYVPFSIQ